MSGKGPGPDLVTVSIVVLSDEVRVCARVLPGGVWPGQYELPNAEFARGSFDVRRRRHIAAALRMYADGLDLPD